MGHHFVPKQKFKPNINRKGEKINMKKRLLASLMSLCLIVGLLPTAAFAAEADTTEEAPQAVVCEVTPGCTLEAGHEGDCVVAPAEGNSSEQENDPDAQPGGENGSEPADPVCGKLAGCVGDIHDPECPLYVAPVEPEELPAPVEPTVEDNVIADPVSLADGEMTGNCGAEGNNITWQLTQNNQDNQNPTYTLTLTGSGAMADYETQGTPWYNYRESITEIILPEGLTRIGKSAFLQTAITKVTIPDTVTSIGQNAFWNCNTIDTEIPANVTELGETAFYGTFKVTVAEDNPNYSAVGKIIYDKNQTKLLQVSQDIEGTLSIPETVEEIGAYTLYGCSDVTGELVIPDSVRIIGDAAFYGTGITSLKLGANVQTIGNNAFQGCTALTGALTIPDSVQTIGAYAFAQANETGNGISAITLGSGVKSVGDYAFYGCSSVTSLTMNEGLESIGQYAFRDLSALSGDLNIPSTVTTIGDGAFRGCTGLSGTLTIGGELKSVDAGFFSSGAVAADGFTAVVLRDGVETIGENAFASWASLASVTIPNSVTTIGDSAFTNCSSLSTVSFGNGIKTIGDSAFTKTALLGELELPAGLEEIGANAFSNCTSITEVNIPDTVTKIGYAAFSYNSGTQKVTIPYRDIEYGTDSDGKAYVFSAYGEDSALKTVVLGSTPENVNADTLFANSLGNIEYLVLGAGVTGIGDWLFSDSSTTLEGGLYPSTLNFDSSHTYLDDKATKFTLTDKTQLTYNSTLKMMTFEKPDGGEDVSGNITYSSSNPEIASVDTSGLITAKSVSNTPVTISASYEGCVFAELELTVTPAVLTYWNKDNEPQQNPGSVTYPVSDEHTNVNDILTFKWSGSDEVVTLNEGEDIDYTYTVPTESGGSGIEATVDFLPMPQGKYQVKFNLVNPNYTFAKTGDGTTNTLTIEANVTAEGLNRAYIAAVKPTETTFTYDGTGKLPAAGTLTAYKEDSTSSETVDIGDFTIHIEGLNDTTFSSTADGIKAGTNLSEISGLMLPSTPGAYVITVSAANESYYIYKSQVFNIQKATVTIKPNDKTAYVGDEVPALGAEDYTVTGLVGNDTLTTAPTLSYASTPDMSTTGTYTIKASGAAANDDLYNLAYEDGTLTVSRRSSGGGGGSSSTNYSISTPPNVDNGSIKVSPTRASKGSTVTITVKPDEGYVLDELVVTDKNGDTVKLTDKGDGKYTFKMPASKVEIEVSFILAADPDVNQPFVDVSPDAYYADAVAWAVENGITNGTSDTTFGPNVSCTRAQMVTFLWRQAGAPKATGSNPFTDVQAGSYYYDAVLWAVEQGITSGTSATTFAPDATVTRAQTVTFLWRQAGAPVVDYAMSFTDVDTNTYYGEAVRWAVSEGVTSGTSATTFSPDVDCTRAQIVTFMFRDMAD